MNDFIDDTFKGLAHPKTIIPIGRDDVVERPGDALVGIVREHKAAGGFAPKGVQTEELEKTKTPGFVHVNSLSLEQDSPPENKPARE